MFFRGLERSGQRNAGDTTVGPHPPLTNPPAAGGAGGASGLFTHTLIFLWYVSYKKSISVHIIFVR